MNNNIWTDTSKKKRRDEKMMIGKVFFSIVLRHSLPDKHLHRLYIKELMKRINCFV